MVSKKKNRKANKTKKKIIINRSYKYLINIDRSTLHWYGYKVTGEHNGTINFSSGYVALDDKTIKSGAFIVDMSTIKDLDIENMTYRKYLEDHLNDKDFFDTKVYPFAKLTILEQLQILFLHFKNLFLFDDDIFFISKSRKK